MTTHRRIRCTTSSLTMWYVVTRHVRAFLCNRAASHLVISDMVPIVRRSLTVIAAVIGPSLAFPSFTVAQHTPVQPSQQNISIPAEGDSVPMLDFGGRPVVEVMINGKGPYKFIFDTGASVNVLDTSVTAELGLDDHAEIQELRLGKISVRQLAAFSNPISQMLGGG